MSIPNFARGDTITYNITVSAPGGGALDLTNHTVLMTFKTSLSLADNGGFPDVLQVTGVVTDAPGGLATATLTSDNTKQMTGGAKYFYDVQVYDTAVPPVVSTIDSGTVTVTADVTNTDA